MPDWLEGLVAVIRVEWLKSIRSVGGLTRAMESSNFHTPYMAAQALEALGGPYVIEPLIGALKRSGTPKPGGPPHGNFMLFCYSSQALGRLGDPRALEPLLDALHDPSELLRSAILSALADLRDPRAAEALVGVMEGDPDKGIRRQAAETLLKMGDPRGIDAIARMGSN